MVRKKKAIKRNGHSTAVAGRGRPRKMALDAASTRDRILDVAEEQFARFGIYGVTVRQVADAAQVDTALVHYYCRDKKNLFLEVVSRRAETLSARRNGALDEYERKCGGDPTVEGAVETFLRAFLELGISGGSAWRNYLAVIVQTHSVPSWADAILARHFDPVTQRFLAIMRKCLPSASAQDIYWSFQQLAGSVMLTVSLNDRIERLSTGKCKTDDLAGAVERMIPYATEGFRAACSGTHNSKSRRTKTPTLE